MSNVLVSVVRRFVAKMRYLWSVAGDNYSVPWYVGTPWYLAQYDDFLKQHNRKLANLGRYHTQLTFFNNM